MRPEVIAQLLEINRAFYAEFAANFHRSRIEPAEGFHVLTQRLPQRPMSMLDVACGNGRLGYFLYQQGQVAEYVGVDFSVPYMRQSAYWQEELAEERVVQEQFRFEAVNMMEAGFLDAFGRFDVVACMSAMHHVPTAARRAELLQEMAAHVRPEGVVLLGNWQFLDSERQRRKLLPWSTVGLTEGDVEAGDHLMSWRRGGFGYRYVTMIDEGQTAELAKSAGLKIVEQFRSDGREGNLNLYTMMRLDR